MTPASISHRFLTLFAAALAVTAATSASAQSAPTSPKSDIEAGTTSTTTTYQEDEVVKQAEEFFGGAAKGIAEAVHSVFQQYGEPNAFIMGDEASGAIVVGLRYGSGKLVMKNGNQAEVYWQGPSAGWDFGGDAVKSFTLVYNLPYTDAIYQRFPGIEGSAYFIGGLGVNYQQRGNVILAPMRAGVGLRLGASVGYLKYTPTREWLPF